MARLIERGLALRGGAVAEFPSITLTNHTSILTGTGPGRHGVMGNVYYDRATGERVVPNDQSTWHRSADWLRPAARTIFEMVAKHSPAGDGAIRTASIDEAIDRGADYATMALIRDSGQSGADALDDSLPDAATSAYLRNPAFLDDAYFRWGVRVDDLGLTQMLDLFATGSAPPLLTWWASVVTDCGHHGGGPRSEMARDALRQSDARLVTFLDHLDGVAADRAGHLPAHRGPRVRGLGPRGDGLVDGRAGRRRRALPRRGARARLPPLRRRSSRGSSPALTRSADAVRRVIV